MVARGSIDPAPARRVVVPPQWDRDLLPVGSWTLGPAGDGPEACLFYPPQPAPSAGPLYHPSCPPAGPGSAPPPRVCPPAPLQTMPLASFDCPRCSREGAFSLSHRFLACANPRLFRPCACLPLSCPTSSFCSSPWPAPCPSFFPAVRFCKPLAFLMT